MIQLEKTKIGVCTLKVNGKYVHSKYDPIKEADKFIENINIDKHPKYIVIYGLGLGYHIKSLLKNVDKNTRIIVFEANNKILKICKDYNKDIFKDKMIEIMAWSESFYESLNYYLEKATDIIIHKPSLEAIKEGNNNLYSLLNEYLMGKESIEKNKDLLDLNYELNIKEKCLNIKEFLDLGREKKPYLIVAGGPSLDRDIEVIKENQKRFNIITVGTAFSTLMKNEIIPSAVVVIDGKDAIHKQLRGYENLNIPLCFLSTASNLAVKNYNGLKYIFYNSEGESDIIISTGKTVAVAAMDIAIKCGAKEIVMVGQDLAFLNGKTHLKEYENMYGMKDDWANKVGNIYVEGIDGSQLLSTKGYLFFKNQIERLILKNNNIKFVNCSHGAKINGAIHCNIRNYLKG